MATHPAPHERALLGAELARRASERKVHLVFQGREVVGRYEDENEASAHLARLVDGGESAADVWGCTVAAPEASEPEWLTVIQAAEKLGVQPNRVRVLIQNGRLPARKFGSEYQIHPDDIESVADRKPGRPVEEGTTMFMITRKDGTTFRVRANNYLEAGGRAARKLHGSRAKGLRTTGDGNKSGMFQAYLPVPQRLGGGLNSVGDPFHVTEA